MATASTVVQNLTQLNTTSTHLERDVSSVLTKLAPDRFPLDTLSRRMPQGERAKAVKVEWEQYGVYPRLDTVTTDTGAGAAEGQVTLPVDHASRWRADDVFVLPDSPASGAFLVESVTSTQVKIRQLGLRGSTSTSGFGTVPAITSGTRISWIGNAKQEGGSYSSSRTTMPDLAYNYCEIMDAVVKVSGTRKNTVNYTSTQDWDRARRENLLEFRQSIEYKKFFGQASETVDSTSGELRWTMNGVVSYITKNFTYNKAAAGTKITESNIIDWLVEIFAGNNGSETRFLFADSYLLGELLKVDLVNLRSRSTQVVLGVKMDRIEFNFGVLFVKHHRGFNEFGKSHYGVVLDMEQIRSRSLQPMALNVLQLRQQGTNADAEQYLEQSTIEVRNPDAHAIISGI